MEIFTLIVLAASLVVKFVTSRQMEALEIEKTEVDNENNRLRTSHQKALENRREAEDRLRLFQHDRIELEKRLKLAEEELEELVERNNELEGD